MPIFTGRYMHPFLHVPSKGYSGVLLSVSILCICFILMGLFYIWISNIIQKIRYSSLKHNDKNGVRTINK